jgi:hypothetical protein
MKSTLTLAVGGFLLLATPAFAQSTCVRPTAPAPVSGAGLSVDQLAAAKKNVQDFLSASDAYQSCLMDGLNAQRAAAKADKTKFDKAIATDVTAKIDANQADKVKVGTAYNEAVRAYKAANPG